MRFSFEIRKEPPAEEGCLMSLSFTAQKISGSLFCVQVIHRKAVLRSRAKCNVDVPVEIRYDYECYHELEECLR